MDGFLWDDANHAHIARHAVTIDEVEQVFAGQILEVDVQHEGDEIRFLWLGETARGRILLVAFTERGDSIRPVTAFEPHPFLRRRYFNLRGSGK